MRTYLRNTACHRTRRIMLRGALDTQYAIDDAHLAFSKIVNGDVFGKIVLHI